MKLLSKKSLVYVALGIVSLLGLVGCGGTESTPTPTVSTESASSTTNQANVQQVTITAKDNEFEPKTLTVEADKPIQLTVINAGQNIHEVEVVDLLPETKLGPGQSKIVEIAPQKAGTHKIYCEIHEDAAMEGEFIVK